MNQNASISEQLRPLARKLRPSLAKIRQVVQVTADIDGADKSAAVDMARRDVLRWMQARVGILPKEAWDLQDFEHTTPGRFSAGVRIDVGNVDYWAVRCDDPDKTIPGQTWTTEANVARRADSAVFGVRLVLATSEDQPRFVPSVPGIVRQLSEDPGISRRGRSITDEPWILSDEDDLQDFVNLVCDSRRRRPVYAVSLPEGQSDLESALIDVRNLAVRCIGIAYVAVLPADLTFSLTDELGKQLSVFRGAVRTYRPGFTPLDDPYRHPLALPEQLIEWEEEGPRAFVDLLVRGAAFESLYKIKPEKDFPTFTQVKQASIKIRRDAAEKQGAHLDELLELASAEIEEKEREIEDLTQLAVEEERLRQEAEERGIELEAKLKAANYRISTLTAKIEEASGQSVDSNVPLVDSYDDLGIWCEEHLAGRLVLLPRALRAAQDGKYTDVPHVCRCLLALANEYRQMRLHGGAELKEVCEARFEELGVRNESCGAEHLLREQGDEFEVQWNGKRRLLKWHLKNGGNTRAPERCLRIYYFWDEDTDQVVEGSLPGHLHTRAT